ncbi:MAG TPA: chitosanase [Pyrinomonadaceae bacterium]|nr:chitosanase [Pyrinomonadaceae bacterium]
MQLSANQKRLVERIINVFETGTPDGDYSNISIYHDGPHNIRQITYGRSQTTEYGNLRRLVEDYVAAGGLFSQQLQPYADQAGSTPLTDDANFKNLLRRAGRQDPVMRRVQDRFFDEVYFRPAMRWADQNGFTQPLSALVIYDSFIHSGSILWPIRNMFPESPPSSGGNEQAWTTAYVNARHNWLRTHPRPPVRLTTYRTQCFKREIQRANWDLSQVPVNANGTQVS